MLNNYAKFSIFAFRSDIFLLLQGTFSEQVERLLEVNMSDHQCPLKVLSRKGLCEATTRFLENNDDTAFEDVINYYCTETKKKLIEKDFDEEEFDTMLSEVHNNTNDDAEVSDVSVYFSI